MTVLDFPSRPRRPRADGAERHETYSQDKRLSVRAAIGFVIVLCVTVWAALIGLVEIALRALS